MCRDKSYSTLDSLSGARLRSDETQNLNGRYVFIDKANFLHKGALEPALV